jgi:hypothetical protein
LYHCISLASYTSRLLSKCGLESYWWKNHTHNSSAIYNILSS